MKIKIDEDELYPFYSLCPPDGEEYAHSAEISKREYKEIQDIEKRFNALQKRLGELYDK